jgi:hypothetical protein
VVKRAGRHFDFNDGNSNGDDGSHGGDDDGTLTVATD